MRTLTLGVLIVTGGTLAALPFRRYQAIPDASSTPVQATGPMESVLDRAVPSPIRAGALVNDPGGDQPALRELVQNLPRWQPAARPVEPRRMDIPLTFEDLALPIDLPAPLEERFTAVASVREKQLAQERASAFEMPPMESLAVTQQEAIRRIADAGSDAQRATASLASAPARPTVTESLPAPEVRQKHWIRQP